MTTPDPQYIETEIRRILDDRRQELLLTVDELAIEAGLDPEEVAAYFAGERPLRLGEFGAITLALRLDPGAVAEEVMGGH